MNIQKKHQNIKRLKIDESIFAKMSFLIGFVHSMYAIVFIYTNINFMIYYNIIAALFYLVIGILVRLKNNSPMHLILSFLEILIFSTLGNLFLGYEFGFSLYFATMIPLTMYLFHLIDSKRILFARRMRVLVLIYTTSILLSLLDVCKIPISDENYKKIIFTSNSIFSFLILISFFFVFLNQIKTNEVVLKKENESLQNIANYDPLTKLLNRRTFDFYYEEHIKNITKLQDFSMFLLDIDDFKIVNDTYGHDVGDIVLIEIAKILKEEVSEIGQAFRWGGEEMLCMVSLSEREAHNLAMCLCKKIREHSFKCGEVTVSIGVSSYKNGDTSDSLIKKADRALYFGKIHGKNQANVYIK